MSNKYILIHWTRVLRVRTIGTNWNFFSFICSWGQNVNELRSAIGFDVDYNVTQRVWFLVL